MRRHELARMLLIGVAASIVGVAITLWMDWFPEQGATAADDIDLLYDVLLIASVPVFVLVMTIAIYSVIRFRAKPGDLSDGAPIHGNTRLEIIWVTIPFIMVTALAIYGWVVLDDIEAKKPNELRVNVTGQQFAWRFEYPAQEVRSNQLVLPKDRPVHFYINSEDVIHSFWVPEFRLKSDAVPGITTHIRLTPNKIDEYPVVCAELCGIGHSTMRQQVRVIEQADWDQWVSERQRRAEGGGGEEQAAADGAAIFTETGCNACHTLADAGSTAEVGPNLDELAQVAGRREPGTEPEAYVEEAITDPSAFVVEGFDDGLMPSDYGEQLSPEEIDALVQYLLGAGE
jgi:cytochrome c oxidase subunit II